MNIVYCSLKHYIKKKIALKYKDNHVLKNKEKIKKFHETWVFQPLVFGSYSLSRPLLCYYYLTPLLVSTVTH